MHHLIQSLSHTYTIPKPINIYNAVAFSGVADCWSLGLTIILLCLTFCLYLPRVKVFGFSLFGLFPILLAITITWSLGGILTATEVFDSDSKCSTAQSLEYTNAVPWFYFPYPFQFGMPQFRSYAIVPMIGSMLASMVEVSCISLSFFCHGIASYTPSPNTVDR